MTVGLIWKSVQYYHSDCQNLCFPHIHVPSQHNHHVRHVQHRRKRRTGALFSPAWGACQIPAEDIMYIMYCLTVLFETCTIDNPLNASPRSGSRRPSFLYHPVFRYLLLPLLIWMRQHPHRPSLLRLKQPPCPARPSSYWCEAPTLSFRSQPI